jgi:hypothetical protein
MKFAAVSLLVSFALLSQAFAVLRPLFPLKPAPPLGDELIVPGDEVRAIGINRRQAVRACHAVALRRRVTAPTAFATGLANNTGHGAMRSVSVSVW